MGYHKNLDDFMSDNKKIWDSYVSLSKLNKTTTKNEGVNEGIIKGVKNQDKK